MENQTKVFTWWTKLDSTNFNAEKNLYNAECVFPDWEVIKFSFSPVAWVTGSWIEYVWRLHIPTLEYPVNVKLRTWDKWAFLSGCLSFDDWRWATLKQQVTTESVPVYTISFSKPSVPTETKVSDVDWSNQDLPF